MGVGGWCGGLVWVVVVGFGFAFGFLITSGCVGDRLGVTTYLVKPHGGRPQGFQVKKMATIHPDAAKQKLIIAKKRSFKGSLVDDGR